MHSHMVPLLEAHRRSPADPAEGLSVTFFSVRISEKRSVCASSCGCPLGSVSDT